MPRRSLFFLISFSALLALGFTTARANRHHHSFNISGGHRQPATDCSDPRIRFDDQDAVVRSEERTLTKAEAAVLQVHPHSNGGVQVVGWDKETYSVTACKAAGGSGEAAERIVSQISMMIENGRVSTKGPGDEGKLTARAKNGPISLKNFSGDAEITAVNGPISLDSSRGSVRIHTENGPISVELEGKTWSGTGLTADAKNGPVTLRVPSGYQSSFVVESTNHAPVSCKASICDNARKTWDDEHRRIEYGNAPAMIRLSTVNGPVSVQESREKL